MTLFISYLLLFQLGVQTHTFEIYAYEESCVPLEIVETSRSFYLTWYDYAKQLEPKGPPLLNSKDILRFNASNFTLELSKSGKEKMSAKEIPTQGIPIFLVIDGKVAYGVWLWNLFSSRANDGVTAYCMSGDYSKLHIFNAPNQGNELRLPAALK